MIKMSTWMKVFGLLALLANFLAPNLYSDFTEELEIGNRIVFPDGSIQTTAYPVAYFNVSTNMVFRGEWTNNLTYYTNDYVKYRGNLFLLFTNIATVGGEPSVDTNGVGINNAFWDVLVAKGNVGATGPPGQDGLDGAVTTNITVYFYSILGTNNNIFLNEPATSNDLIVWQYKMGDTNYYRFVASSNLLGSSSGGGGTTVIFNIDGGDIIVSNQNIALEINTTNNFATTVNVSNQVTVGNISVGDTYITNRVSVTNTVNVTNSIVVGSTTVNNTNTFIITNNLTVGSVQVTNSFSPTINTTNNVIVGAISNTFIVSNNFTSAINITNVNNITNNTTVNPSFDLNYTTFVTNNVVITNIVNGMTVISTNFFIITNLFETAINVTNENTFSPNITVTNNNSSSNNFFVTVNTSNTVENTFSNNFTVTVNNTNVFSNTFSVAVTNLNENNFSPTNNIIITNVFNNVQGDTYVSNYVPISVNASVTVAGVNFEPGAFSNSFEITVNTTSGTTFAEGAIQATISSAVVENVIIEDVYSSGGISASGDVSLLGNLYAYFTNVFAPILNISITNIVGAVENTINNYVYNTNIVYMENNIGGVQVFTSNTVSFGYTGGTSTPAFVRIYDTDGNMSTGGMDGANLALYVGGGSSSSGGSPISGVYPVGVTNYLGTSYVYLVSSGGIVIQPSIGGTNVIQFGGPTSYFYSVPVDKNLIIVDSWTAAGGGYSGGAGSHSEIYIPVTGGELLEIICGEAGLAVPATNATGLSTARGGWPGGGLGINRYNYITGPNVAGSGGGYSAIKRGTNYIYIGGAGAGGAFGGGGSGGGVSGGNGTAASGGAGVGGTQTDGGAAPTSSVPLGVTNTAGSYLTGGDAGATTNKLTGAAGGGGAGFQGGSGGLAVNAATSRGSGGGGSSWANTNLVLYFSTTRGIGQTPPKQELTYYGSDFKGLGWGVNVSTNGGNAGMVIREATM
jgi:hypothetical protein